MATDLTSASGLVEPAVALDSQRRLGPFRPQAVDGLEHCAPDVVQQIVAIKDQGDRDALAGGQGAKESPLCTTSRTLVRIWASAAFMMGALDSM